MSKLCVSRLWGERSSFPSSSCKLSLKKGEGYSSIVVVSVAWSRNFQVNNCPVSGHGAAASQNVPLFHQPAMVSLLYVDSGQMSHRLGGGGGGEGGGDGGEGG